MIAALENPPQRQTLEVAAVETTGGEDHSVLDDQSLLFGGAVPGTTVYRVTVKTKLEGIRAFKVEALTHESLPGEGPGRGDAKRANFILSELAVQDEAGKPLKLHTPRADFSQNGWPVENAIDGDSKTGWAIGPKFKKPHWASFQTEQPVGSSEGATFVLTLDQNFGSGRTIGRLRLSALQGDADAEQIPVGIAKILNSKKRSKKQTKQLDDFYAKSNPLLRELDAETAKVNAQLAKLEPPTTLVMVEMDKPRKTNILIRGNYLDKGKAVGYGTPARLHALDPKLPKNRLGFARWLVDRKNPLLARVTVNRWWAEIFGNGIVATLEDFGTQSEPPTHPKLLDWLAVEFMESGWSTKHIHKLIVMSSTFRQSTRLTPELLERDRDNKLYARGPRIRMPGEMVRDNALAVSGLLSSRMGGVPVMPYQPEGIWRAVGRNAPKWINAAGEDRFRRGVYIVWRRAAPYPSLVNFDAPDRGTCIVKRSRTNTPLQALTLLNDPAYVEMALALATRMQTEAGSGSPEEIAAYGFRLCFSRSPRPAETGELVKLYQQELARLKKSPELAKAIVTGVKGYKPPKNVDEVELAAWFFVANVLLNLDQTITIG